MADIIRIIIGSLIVISGAASLGQSLGLDAKLGAVAGAGICWAVFYVCKKYVASITRLNQLDGR